MPYKLLFIVAILITAISTCGAQAVTPVPVAAKMNLVIKVPGLVSNDDASGLKDDLDHFNPDKIVSTSFNLVENTFTIVHTDQFNEIETLAFFRTRGFEAYFIKGEYVYRLNGTASGLVQIPYNPAED